jgi:hypothetical protein
MRLYFVPFLGQKTILTGESRGRQMMFRVSQIDRGGVLWLSAGQE